MTTEKMPDVIWAQVYLHPDDGETLMIDAYPEAGGRLSRYLRAEPVEAREKSANDLLKVARDFMSRVARGDYDTGTLLPLILMIDKFLGGKE